MLLKKDYLDAQAKVREEMKEAGLDKLNGNYWYKISAIREVNQVIGRCIK